MTTQLTLNFEPTLPDRFGSLREFVAHRASVVAKPMKAQAADMDLAPSTLSRKLNPTEGDTQRFNCDDLEAWLASTGDAAAIVEYLCAKYLEREDARRSRVLAELEGMLPKLHTLTAALRGPAS